MQQLAFYWQLPQQPLGRLEIVYPVNYWDQLAQVQVHFLISTLQFSLGSLLAWASYAVCIYSTFWMR